MTTFQPPNKPAASTQTLEETALIASLLMPGTFLCLVALLLSLRYLFKRDARKQLWPLIVVLLLLIVLCLPIVNRVLIGSLEWSYPPRSDRPETVEAIVVLGGYVRPAAAPGLKPELGDDSLQRCLRGAELYGKGPPRPIITCGGPCDGKYPPVGQAMRDFLADHGIPPGDLIVEDRSQNTYENAVEVARLLQARGIHQILLVTDATHLWRASLCFQAQGIEVVPCGCRYRASAHSVGLRDFLPDPAASEGGRAAFHEWIGLGWYKVCRRY